MSIIWLDYWTKKTGIAIAIEGIAIPYNIVWNHDLITEIKKLEKEKYITEIIIWISDYLDWRESVHAKRTKKFAHILKKNIDPGIEIIFIDERYSSFEAAWSMESIWFENFDPKRLDDVAASIILQSYLDKK